MSQEQWDAGHEAGKEDAAARRLPGSVTGSSDWTGGYRSGYGDGGGSVLAVDAYLMTHMASHTGWFRVASDITFGAGIAKLVLCGVDGKRYHVTISEEE